MASIVSNYSVTQASLLAVQLAFGFPVFNCIPTIEVICMLVSIHLRWASQQHFVVLLRHYPQSKFTWSHVNTLAKHSCSFLTLADESPKWNILVVTWTLVISLKYTHEHSGCAIVLVRIYFRQISCAHVTTTTYIYIKHHRMCRQNTY